MNAPTGASAAPGDAHEAAEALSLLDALVRAPAAAELVIAALERAEDRKALRLVHTQLRDAVDEATTVLTADFPFFDPAAAARPPTPRRWPRLKELTFCRGPDAAALEALALETWGALRKLRFGVINEEGALPLDAPLARALAAALPRMPALRALGLYRVRTCDVDAAELFRAASADALPQLRAFALVGAGLSPEEARALAATGWRLKELDLGESHVNAASFAALVAAPTFVIRRLGLRSGVLDKAALLALASAPWPLKELDLSCNEFSPEQQDEVEVGPALAALSRHARLRELNVSHCNLSEAGFKAVVEAVWPALISLKADLKARAAAVEFDGPDALGAAAFAGFPALEVLDLSSVRLGAEGARLLASRRWPRLKKLDLRYARLDDAGVAALARGHWPAVEYLDLRHNDLAAPPALEDARRWAPALVFYLVHARDRGDSDPETESESE